MNLSTALEHAYGLTRSSWLELAELQQLPEPAYTFMLLHEWLLYEDWEGFVIAVYHHPDEVAAQLRQELQLPALAACIGACRQRQDELYRRDADLPPQKQWQRLREDEQVQALEAQFPPLRAELVARLQTYVQAHLASFP